jgi:hypothetical protein
MKYFIGFLKFLFLLISFAICFPIFIIQLIGDLGDGKERDRYIFDYLFKMVNIK